MLQLQTKFKTKLKAVSRRAIRFAIRRGCTPLYTVLATWPSVAALALAILVAISASRMGARPPTYLEYLLKIATAWGYVLLAFIYLYTRVKRLIFRARRRRLALERIKIVVKDDS